MKLCHILAATDLSAPASHAVERAALVCQETGAALDLLHVANLTPLERLRELMMETQEELQLRVLDVARDRLLEQGDVLLNRYGVSVGIHVASGVLLTELANAADAMSIDMVVCGARGESFARHLFLGSTAERLLSETNCPMLIVKQAAHEQYRTVLVPVDFSPSSLRAIKHARAIAPHAKIVLLHAFEVPFEGQLRYASVDDDTLSHYRIVASREASQKLQVLREATGLVQDVVQLVLIHGDPSLRIIEQEQELNCDLIVMGKHGDNTLEELFLGSVTKHVLNESQCDVLVSEDRYPDSD